MSIELPNLPYPADALEPFLSKTTMDTHYGKHHRGYVDKLNGQIAGSRYEGLSLEDIALESRKDKNAGIFNNAAQVINHTFLWHSMSPEAQGEPDGKLGDALKAAFGDLDGFHKAFSDAATGQFGSGWAWLVADNGELRVISTGNADTPLVHGLTPLLTLDVWEHAYYLDYKNERGRYVDTYLNGHVAWSFAAENFVSADA